MTLLVPGRGRKDFVFRVIIKNGKDILVVSKRRSEKKQKLEKGGGEEEKVVGLT